jgi:hypothetical protein
MESLALSAVRTVLPQWIPALLFVSVVIVLSKFSSIGPANFTFVRDVRLR